MLDVNLIRGEPEKVKGGVASKNVDPKLVDRFLRFDDEWRNKTVALDQLKAEQNALNKEMAKRKSDDVLSRAQILKKRVSEVSKERDGFLVKRDETLAKLPNLPFEDTPVGKDATANKVIREWGKKPKFSGKDGFPPKDYLSLGETLGLVNVRKAAEVSGSRFGYLLNEAVLLEFALVRLAFDLLLKEGFRPVVPPVMIRPKVFEGMGRLTAGEKDERYFLPKDDLYLVGSAEHTLGPLHLNEVLNGKDLPLRYVGFSTCFRREAGSYGKDTKGILRVHQFDKIEMFSFSRPEDSNKECDFMLLLQEKLMQALELPYRVVAICTGDMGFTDAKQYDIETWLPGANEYRETHSCSNTTDFQARGTNVKYKTKDGKKEFVHMLNATGFAIGRTLIAIFENYQTKNGAIKVPEALREYIGKDEIETKEKRGDLF
ncbi:MAG: serine--tRNA ligase [Patescibacteria group bacterium]